MKLYELPRQSYFKIDDTQYDTGDIYLLDHIDGMYSVCYRNGRDICHVAAFEEVTQVEIPDV